MASRQPPKAGRARGGWVQTAQDDKAGCPSSPCRDRKGTVTTCTQSLSKHSGPSLGPRHTSPAWPWQANSAAAPEAPGRVQHLAVAWAPATLLEPHLLAVRR